MVKKVSILSICAIVGGLHLPIKNYRITKKGVRLQFIMGSGFPSWKRMDKKDLDEVIELLNQNDVKHLLLFSHDTYDYALKSFKIKSISKVENLIAGETYSI